MLKYLPILFFTWSLIFAQPEDKHNQRELRVGEVLVYSVNYSVLELGELKFKVISKDKVDGEVNYRTIVWIKSADWVPFVDIFEIYESKYNEKNFSEHFRATQYHYERARFTEYDFDYAEGDIKVKKGYLNPYEVLVDSTCDLNHSIQDGLSLFYFARLYDTKKDSVTTLVFENEKPRKIEINYKRESFPVEIPAIDYAIDCYYVYGKVGFTSIFGLTGKFSGWFTNDEQAVPIKAKLKVRIGSITAELKEWRKGQWKPPRYIK